MELIHACTMKALYDDCKTTKEILLPFIKDYFLVSWKDG